MSESMWKPIANAPRDGRRILLTVEGWVGEAYYSNDACRWFEQNTHPTDATDGEVWQPTHWMPLPEPPKC